MASKSSFITQVNDPNVGEDSLGVWWIGQGSMVLKFGPTVIWVDPYLDPETDRPAESRRMMPPPCAPEQVTNADVVLADA